MNYFDFLPEDVIGIVLVNINPHYYSNDMNDLNNLTKFSDVIKGILSDYKFWNIKIKKNMPEVDLSLIPNYLYDFRNKKLINILANVSLLYSSYFAVIEIMEEHEDMIREKDKDEGLNEDEDDDDDEDKDEDSRHAYILSCVNNFDIVNLARTTGVSDNVEEFLYDKFIKGEFAYDAWASIEMILYANNKYDFHFTFSGPGNEIVYNVSKKDIFNALMHIHCNGATRFDV